MVKEKLMIVGQLQLRMQVNDKGCEVIGLNCCWLLGRFGCLMARLSWSCCFVDVDYG